ncbi:MAG: hypothetical protein AB1546_14450 [bacterium]
MTLPDGETSFLGYDKETLNGDELLELSIAQLDEIFTGAEAPGCEEMGGRYRCLWLSGEVDGYLPKPLKKLRAMIAGSRSFPWKGMEIEKRFDESDITGTNLLFDMDKGVRMFHFDARIEPSEFDGKDCLAFDYDTEKNILPFRKLRDEVRKVNPTLYLGRGNLMLGGKARLIAYFTLEPGY